jgi:hypothetical protein
MSHSPLHQRMHLHSLAMRQNLSSPLLSPLPPYPTPSPLKIPQELPAAAPPTPDPTSYLEPAAPTEPGKAVESIEEPNSMRATHVRPRTAPASPERPSTVYSTRSTIRQIDPSPESLRDAFAQGFADTGTPALPPSFDSFPPFKLDSSGPTGDNYGEYWSTKRLPSTEPISATEEAPGILRRGGTPSDRSSPRKSRSCSPQKSRSASPRKQLVRTPALPVHQESPNSAYSDLEKLDAPDTPSPVSRQQKRDAYTPLQVRKLFEELNGEGDPATGHGTHTVIVDYKHQVKTQQAEFILIPTGNPPEKIEAPQPVKRIATPVAHIVQAMAESHTVSEDGERLPPRQEQLQMNKEPNRRTTASRRSQASGASVASRHSVFSTPGRDEMERKKPIIEEDDGPFAKVKSVKELNVDRRKVSEGTTDGVKKKDGRRLCGMRCAMM